MKLFNLSCLFISCHGNHHSGRDASGDRRRMHFLAPIAHPRKHRARRFDGCHHALHRAANGRAPEAVRRGRKPWWWRWTDRHSTVKAANPDGYTVLSSAATIAQQMAVQEGRRL